MTSNQLYNVAISKVNAKENCEWFKIWNGNKTMKEKNIFLLDHSKAMIH
jgi:hypothetical protein